MGNFLEVLLEEKGIFFFCKCDFVILNYGWEFFC